MLKRPICFVLALFIIMISTSEASAVESLCDGSLKVYPQECHLPNDGIDHFYTEYVPSNDSDGNSARSLYNTVYGFEYIQGALAYGSWRNGASGGCAYDEIELHFDRGNDMEYNISFTATVTGEYTLSNKAKIGADLGVTLGATRTYTLGSGASVTVPVGAHYTIIYRPAYYIYTVVETTYLEAYLPGYGWDRNVVDTKTSNVLVFSHWDFSLSKG